MHLICNPAIQAKAYGCGRDRQKVKYASVESRAASNQHQSANTTQLKDHTMTPLEIRQQARSGFLSSPTTGLAPAHIQANLLVLPICVAKDFELLCIRNPVPCPLLGRSSTPGNPYSFSPSNLFLSRNTEAVNEDITTTIDIRTDIPAYNIYKHGRLVESKSHIREEWTTDSVAFLIGCSFSFESALSLAGLQPRQISTGTNVPMYKTTIKLHPAGVFTGASMVVSMRPYQPKDVEKVRSITRPFTKTHGEPIAWGWEAVTELGIKDIHHPDFGDPASFEEGEVPVFWGCGVTPQVAVMAAGNKIPGLVMAHKPGHMLVLDMTEEELFAAEGNGAL